jgi:hypothetical protein
MAATNNIIAKTPLVGGFHMFQPGIMIYIYIYAVHSYMHTYIKCIKFDLFGDWIIYIGFDWIGLHAIRLDRRLGWIIFHCIYYIRLHYIPLSYYIAYIILPYITYSTYIH